MTAFVELGLIAAAILFGSKQRRELVVRSILGLTNFISTANRPTLEHRANAEARQAEILLAIQSRRVPTPMQERLHRCRDGTAPWISTLKPAELMIARSHGIWPISAVSATCWLHYGYSWTPGHAEGWETALRRLREEAMAAGANAVLDVKMRTVKLNIADSMDFSLVGTAVKIDGLSPSEEPAVATVPALEFVKLVEAGIIPIGLAVGAEYRWYDDYSRRTNLRWTGNIESEALSELLDGVRRTAHGRLRASAKLQHGSALAHTSFSQMFEMEVNERKKYLARHIVIATLIDTPSTNRFNHELRMVVDMHAGKTPLTGRTKHHQSFETNDEDGAI